jgi:hypothetical protein
MQSSLDRYRRQVALSTRHSIRNFNEHPTVFDQAGIVPCQDVPPRFTLLTDQRIGTVKKSPYELSLAFDEAKGICILASGICFRKLVTLAKRCATQHTDAKCIEPSVIGIEQM